MVSLLMAAIAMLSMAMLSALRSAHKENQGSQEALAALYASEAGLTAAIEDLVRGGSGRLGSEDQPVTFGGQRYWVESNDIGDGRIALVSYGSDDRASMGVELVVQPTSSGFFRWAAFGDEEMVMASNSRTDSYDSTAGDYDSQATNGSGTSAWANDEGDIGCNGSIQMYSNVGVWGDASPGPGESVAGNLSDISGSTTPMPTRIELPDIVVPAVSTSGDLLVSSSQTLVSGTYGFDSLTVESSKSLTILGPATIVCTDFMLKSNSEIKVDASAGPVEFFVLGDFVLNSNTTISSSEGSPKDVEFNLLSDNILDPDVDVDFDEAVLDFDSGSQLFGTIFAPSASVKINSNFQLFGSLVARRVALDSNCRIHYDESLATSASGSSVSYQTLCWRIVARP